ncbi:outer membrane lipoprotein carrier protein LolA [Bradymonadaceae bacterium TMQ3]|uniref:Outer membrane lipoprotein carrier protein LolA n=1 Tax=Lujinxingia sediminis TaxID=2480984 RepID=A0ABY0CSH6_9DELT|nr:outer membrane lipoprotein carrier protein LolA [Lujinxingia sediminis]RDV38844.1 outer membrane lipoprotein carrier protein LolA [Bradymonadaceae bacterium TMQ3]RVU44078.1 outer membrane lipoprotein carrier protein LolA [Lujinxingia sediminis]TXC76384.1 outer membrane lipoprotein carrier protein LolA [Bradymonadales bacterium TMQ1]
MMTPWMKIAAAAAAGSLAALTALSQPLAQESGEGSQAAEAPAAMSADDVARRVQRFYQETSDFQAAFAQTYTDIAAGESKRSRGRVYFKKPGKMRWDYYSPTDATQRERVLVSDGSAFWIYEFEFQQVFKQCLADSQLPTSLRFLMGQGDLLEEFDAELSERSTAQAPELKLTPKEPTPHYRELRFRVDPQTFQVTRTTVYDPYGNTNEIVFQNTRVNRNLPDSGFEFEAPQGARLLNAQQECD